MNIGIDLDNTIARYDTSFGEVALAEGFIAGNWDGKGKSEFRDYLRRHPDGEITWMKLQGLVYGKFMHRAEMMPGAAGFLLKCRSRNHEVFIVSHKTEFGHFDPEKFSLHREALKWMEAKRFFDPDYFGIKKENIFFADTREEKVEIIAQLECDYFIDDLPEVFAEEKFPSSTKKILFGQFDSTEFSNDITPMSNWGDISNTILGYTTDDDLGTWANLLVSQPSERIEKISGRGNSRLYKVMTTDGNLYALKYYPDQLTDDRPRLKTEFHALRLLHQNNITNVPKAIEKDEDLNLGLYEWMEGEPVTDPTLDDLGRTIDFVEKLHLLSRKIDENNIKLASEACLSAADLIGQTEERFKRLNAVRGSSPELSNFLEHTFEPLWEEVRDESYSLWPVETQDRSLTREKQTLSPSDFGFHNTIQDSDGKLTFIDFEYFGWDDPVKLTADFIWHPAMELDSETVAEWEKAMLDLFSGDPDFADRLSAAMPLYGMRWAMILLNEFLPGFAERRRNAGRTSSYDEEKSQIVQLSKARRYCERVERISS